MKILAIESSCDDTAVAIVENRKVLSSLIASQVDDHIVFGGVVPEIASRMHIEAISNLYKEALKQADCTIDDIDAIAVTYAPGLIGSLLVGVSFAKGLAYASNKPLIPVHHLRSHIAANYISHTDLKPPFM
ncbi:MAG: tRNA (adenosine(37)-N6)-threonylcarbamoyltransferase complex transferase subunit TsaD, partial [Acutalibacteraceae bacterium]